MDRKASLTLRKRLAIGGMGEVYEAILEDELGVQYRVAAKRIKESLKDDPQSLVAFEREVAVSARLNHPNVIRILRSLKQDDQIYLLSELLEGVSLSSLLKSGQTLSQEEKILISVGILEAVIYAHDFRDFVTSEVTPIIHRDISPQNVIATVFGEIKLIDFGLARLEHSPSESRNSEENLAGKLSYLAPELLDGKQPDVNSDAYSVGVLLFYLFSGNHPFDRRYDAATVEAVQSASRPDLNEMTQDLNAESIDLINDLISGASHQRARLLRPLLSQLKQQVGSVMHARDQLAEHVKSELNQGQFDVAQEHTLSEVDFAKSLTHLRKRNRRRIMWISIVVTVAMLASAEFIVSHLVERQLLGSLRFHTNVELVDSDGRTLTLLSERPTQRSEIYEFYPDEQSCVELCKTYRERASSIFGITKVRGFAALAPDVAGMAEVFNSYLRPFMENRQASQSLRFKCSKHDVAKEICGLTELEHGKIFEKFESVYPLVGTGARSRIDSTFTASAINARMARGTVLEDKLAEAMNRKKTLHQILEPGSFLAIEGIGDHHDVVAFELDKVPNFPYDCSRLGSSLLALRMMERVNRYESPVSLPTEILVFPKGSVALLRGTESALGFQVIDESQLSSQGLCRMVVNLHGDTFARIIKPRLTKVGD